MIDRKRIALVVEDDPSLKRTLEAVFEHYGYEPIIVETVPDATRAADDKAMIDIAVVGYLLKGDGTGLDVIYHLRRTKPDVPIIFMSGIMNFLKSQAADQARAMGVGRLLQKPFDLKDFLGML